MLQFPHFLRACPVCGRPLQVRVEYVGRLITCRHCGGSFVAGNPFCPNDPMAERNSHLLRKAERLLEIAKRRLQPDHGLAAN